jgi:pimeloyl-ACP methyl ester carboxylesterase
MDSNDELLEKGIDAARRGNLDQATALLARVIKTNPASDKAWLWMGKCINNPSQKEFCLQRALHLNPQNADAREELEWASRQKDFNNPVAIPSLGRHEPQPAVPPTIPASTPPFLSEAAKYGPGEPSSGGFGQIQAEDPDTAAGDFPTKKTRKATAVLWVILPVILCAGALAVFYISGLATTILESLGIVEPLPTQASLPTSQPSLTPLPVIPTQTSTPEPVIPALFTPQPTIQYAASFEETPCRYADPNGVLVTCGYLSVPENRTDPDSESIRLAVAVFHSPNPHPAADPVLFLQGGPGAEAVLTTYQAFSILGGFLENRDYIAYDQRGTGLSRPALGCDDLTHVFYQDILGQLPESSRAFIYDNAFRSCHGAMTVAGTDLTQYNTLNSAADIKDLITALGYQQVNLYGGSYGTRLAQVVMRDYPEIVRSAILDSVVPIEVSIYTTDSIRYGNPLNSLFETCAQDPICNQTFPDLGAVFWDTVQKMDDDPVMVDSPLPTSNQTVSELVDGSDLIGLTTSLLKNGSYIRYAPYFIYSAKEGDYSIYEQLQNSLPFAFEGIDIGLYITVMCHEHVMSTTQEALQTEMDALHDLGEYGRLPFIGDAEDMFRICELWKSPLPLAGENDPVISSIPALVIEGKFDTATPPVFGQMVAAHLSRSFYYEFPNQGHTPTWADGTGCAMQIALDFLDDPIHAPDGSCIQALPKVDFVLP